MNRMPHHALRPLLALLGALVLAPLPGAAQADLGSAWTASRAELERRVTQLDALAGSTAYSERARARSAQEAANIRRRLSEGDFRVGDRIYIEIEGSIPEGIEGAAPTLSDLQDTVTVFEGARINVRNIGEISLVGVLRSELQNRVNTAVNEVILNSRALTRPLVRLAVFGAVARPGYYTVPVETRVDDLVMLAGGPAPEAIMNEMRFQRGDTVVLDAEELRNLIALGRVVGAIGLQEGDQLVINRGQPPLQGAERTRFLFFFISPIISALVFRYLR
jgi:protein involved in polysaccharide export with SLBB domain